MVETAPQTLVAAAIRSCMACHGDDRSGRIAFEDPLAGVISFIDWLGHSMIGSVVIFLIALLVLNRVL
jgi:hypothetical protein